MSQFLSGSLQKPFTAFILLKPYEEIYPRGGTIALGHLIECTSAKQSLLSVPK